MVYMNPLGNCNDIFPQDQINAITNNYMYGSLPVFIGPLSFFYKTSIIITINNDMAMQLFTVELEKSK